MPTLEAIRPYVEQLLEDSDVQRQLSRSVANLRAANPRRGSKRRVLQESRRRQRLGQALQAAYAAGVLIQQAPQKQKRRSRRGRVLAVLALAAAGAVAYKAAETSGPDS